MQFFRKLQTIDFTKIAIWLCCLILFSTWIQFSIAVFTKKMGDDPPFLLDFDFRVQILRPYIISAQVFPSQPVLCCRPGCRNYSWIQRHAPGDDGMSSAIGPGGKKGRLQTSCGVCVCVYIMYMYTYMYTCMYICICVYLNLGQ